MVFAGHERAFRLFGGTCRKGIYDNLKTVVQKILLGKDRQFNRRFCSQRLENEPPNAWKVNHPTH